MLKIASYLAGKKHVIWDWNGTLLDDVEHTISVTAGIVARHLRKTLDREEYLARFRFPISAWYQDLGFDFSQSGTATMAALSEEFISSYTAGLGACRLFPGTATLLERLNSEGVACSVLTAAHEGMIKNLVVQFGIAHHFRAVFGLSDIYAGGKLERGRQLMEHLGAEPEDCILVGDTDHDLEVARALGISAILVGDGHQCANRLKSLHPVVVNRHTPQERGHLPWAHR